MRGIYYILDGTKIVTAGMNEWAKFMEKEDRIIAQTPVLENKMLEMFVSTVFLGIDHGFSSTEPPILFETIVFKKNGNGAYTRRYATWDQALAGHQETLDALEKNELDLDEP